MPRLFVAVAMPPDVKSLIALLQAGVPGARWTPRDQLHLTLRFIGDVDGGVHRDVEAALASVRRASFDLRLAGVGHFPPRGAPRILWAGVAPEEACARLQADVERAVTSCGEPPEERRFHAHVTVARLNDAPPRRVADWIASHAGFEAGPFPVKELLLYSSVLGSRGATHRVEAAFPLDP